MEKILYKTRTEKLKECHKKVGLSLIGLGYWSDLILPQIMKSDRVRLISVFTRQEDKRNAYAQKFSCKSASSFEAVLEDPEIDGLILVTPNHLHAEQIALAARSGKHVLVEKPITATLDQAFNIAGIVAQTGMIVSVGHNSRRRPEARYLKKCLEEGLIGESVMIEGTFSSGRGLKMQEGEWRSKKELCPSGPLIQMAVHHADTFQYLLGPVKTVSGVQKRLYTTAEGSDTAITHLEFESGCLGYIGSSYVTSTTYRIVLYGTSGRIFYDDSLGLYLTDAEGKTTKLEIDSKQLRVDNSLLEELDELADCIENGRKPEVSFKEGVMALALIEAAELSMKNNCRIRVADLLKGVNLD